MHPQFDPQPTLTGPTLRLRPLQAGDLEPLHEVANDPSLWAGHPATNRYQRVVFEPYFETLLASRATLVATLIDTGQIIGCSRFYTPPEEDQGISIGYTFLGRAWWGGAFNHDMKALMLAHAFEHVDHVWLHIDPANLRSQRATQKLGAFKVGEGPLNMAGKQGVWQTWRLEQTAWAMTLSNREAQELR